MTVASIRSHGLRFYEWTGMLRYVNGRWAMNWRPEDPGLGTGFLPPGGKA